MSGIRRRVKGSNVIDLIKMIKELRKHGLTCALSVSTEALLNERLLSSDWYPLEPFVELLELVGTSVLRSSEQRAMEMGAAAGALALRGPARLYLCENDPKQTVYAMRHAWRARHDFAELAASMEEGRAVRFAFSGYDDIGMVHALTTVGWGVAAARAAGTAHASYEILERPWRGGASFCYRILF